MSPYDWNQSSTPGSSFACNYRKCSVKQQTLISWVKKTHVQASDIKFLRIQTSTQFFHTFSLSKSDLGFQRPTWRQTTLGFPGKVLYCCWFRNPLRKTTVVYKILLKTVIFSVLLLEKELDFRNINSFFCLGRLRESTMWRHEDVGKQKRASPQNKLNCEKREGNNFHYFGSAFNPVFLFNPRNCQGVRLKMLEHHCATHFQIGLFQMQQFGGVHRTIFSFAQGSLMHKHKLCCGFGGRSLLDKRLLRDFYRLGCKKKNLSIMGDWCRISSINCMISQILWPSPKLSWPPTPQQGHDTGITSYIYTDSKCFVPSLNNNIASKRCCSFSIIFQSQSNKNCESLQPKKELLQSLSDSVNQICST